MREHWLPVTGFSGYMVSDHGRVRSISRILKPWWVSNDRGRRGHLVVALGRARRAKVSHLVLEAFVGPRPEGLIACHIDDDPANNHVTNLRWGTYSSNMHDMVRNGRHNGVNKTECRLGHPLSSYPNGKRYCRVCKSDQKRIRKERARAGLPPRPPGRPKKVTDARDAEA